MGVMHLVNLLNIPLNDSLIAIDDVFFHWYMSLLFSHPGMVFYIGIEHWQLLVSENS